MKQRCSIYLMPTGFHVTTQSTTIHGIGVHCEPMFIVDSGESDEALGRKVMDALASSQEDIAPPNHAELSKRLLSFLRVRSWKALARQGKLIDIVLHEGNATIIPSRACDDGSFEPVADSQIGVAAPSHQSLGTSIRAAFRDI